MIVTHGKQYSCETVKNIPVRSRETNGVRWFISNNYIFLFILRKGNFSARDIQLAPAINIRLNSRRPIHFNFLPEPIVRTNPEQFCCKRTNHRRGICINSISCGTFISYKIVTPTVNQLVHQLRQFNVRFSATAERFLQFHFAGGWVQNGDKIRRRG